MEVYENTEESKDGGQLMQMEEGFVEGVSDGRRRVED